MAIVNPVMYSKDQDVFLPTKTSNDRLNLQHFIMGYID